MVKALTQTEVVIVKRIVSEMRPAERKSYSAYGTGVSYLPGGLEDIETCAELHRKGWLTAEPEFFKEEPLYLTRAAWGLYALDEWHEIEEQSVREQIKHQFGEW